MSLGQLHYGAEVEDYKFSEDKLEAYIELLLSKVPQLKTIDDALKESYYVKIGNISNFNMVNANEHIDTFSAYQSWKDILNSIENDLGILAENHQIFNTKRSLVELEEIKRETASRGDFEGIEIAGNEQEVQYSISDADKDYINLVLLFIAIITFGESIQKSLMENFDNKSIYILLFLLFVFVFRDIFKGMFKVFTSKDNIKYGEVQVIEYRSRNKFIGKLNWERHNKNYIEGLNNFIFELKLELFADIDNEIKIKKILSRINTEHKKIYVKLYTPDGLNGTYFINDNNKLLKKIKIHFFLILSLEIKIQNKNTYNIYIDTIKIYYSFKRFKTTKTQKVLELEQKIESSFYSKYITKIVESNFNI